MAAVISDHLDIGPGFVVPLASSFMELERSRRISRSGGRWFALYMFDPQASPVMVVFMSLLV